MFCTECGTQVDRTFKFCPECGNKLFLLSQKKAQGKFPVVIVQLILTLVQGVHLQP